MTGRPGSLTTIVAVGALLLTFSAAPSASAAVGTLEPVAAARPDDRAASRSLARSAPAGVPPIRFPGFATSQRVVGLRARVVPPVAAPTAAPAGLLPSRPPRWVRTVWGAPSSPWT
jgi:hypothetical protein